MEPSEDEFKRGHKYPFMSCELLNCDVPKFLDLFTMTECQRLQKDRKSSNADSDLGNSEWNFSNRDWLDKKDDAADEKNKNEDNEKKTDKQTNLNEASQEKAGFLADAEEKAKEKEIAEDACEVINDAAAVEEEKDDMKANASNESLKEKVEGIYFLLFDYFLVFLFIDSIDCLFIFSKLDCFLF